MICAEDELGLGSSHDGIMILDPSLVPGTPGAEVFNVEKDEVFEIGLTPNRADAMSHFGVARDLRAGLMQQDINIELISPSVSDFHVDERKLKIDVEVEDKDLAPRYCGISITDVRSERFSRMDPEPFKSLSESRQKIILLILPIMCCMS